MDKAHSPFAITGKYLWYFLTALNGKGHGIHSPFVFDFVKRVLNRRELPRRLEAIETLRKKLRADPTLVPMKDYGAGAKEDIVLNVSTIVKHSAKSKKYARLLYKVADHYHAQRVVEMGTSFGISTSYLAMSNPAITVTTGEGNDFIALYACEGFQKLGLNNIQVITGDFAETLPDLFSGSEAPDLIFVDGNHREEATVRYFEYALTRMAPSGVLVFDDIHWSAGMESAWRRIKAHESVFVTIDLFFMGLVFFRSEFKVKQHFVIRY